MYICLCKAVTEKAVRQACADGANTLADLQDQLGVATGCGQCAEMACSLIAGGDTDLALAPSAGRYTNAGDPALSRNP